MTTKTGVAASAQSPSEVRQVFSGFRGALFWLALFSGIINLLMLTGAVFMLEVYDRVLPSASVATLVALAMLAAALFALQAVLDIIRSRIFVRIGSSLYEIMSARVFEVLVRMPLRGRGRGDGLQPKSY